MLHGTKRQLLQEFVTPSTAQPGFGSAKPMAITMSCFKNYVQLPVS